MDADVVIAGAGPVGLMLACELRLYGADTVVVEKLTEAADDSRAQALHGRTVPTLDRRGLLPRFRAAERRLNGGAADSRRARALPKAHFAGIGGLKGTPVDSDPDVPVVVFVPQNVTVALLAERAAELGVRLARGTELVGCAQDPEGVTAQVRTRHGDGELRARYLVGCDGSRSVVRGTAGIDFAGSGASLCTIAAEVRLGDTAGLPTGWHRTRHGCTVISPHPAGGFSRVVAIDFTGPAPDRSAPVTLEELSSQVARIIGRPIAMTELGKAQRYGDAAKIAERYRSSRVFLAGDAAHIHYPVGGMGLNIGLQDAANLGWKLAAVLGGWAPPGLLDTYHAERHPVAAEALMLTRAQVSMLNPDPRVDALRDLLATLITFDAVDRYLAEKMSAADVRYNMGVADPHPLVGQYAPSLRLETAEGVRRLADYMNAGRPVLLDLTDSAMTRATAVGWTDRVDVRTARCPDHPDLTALLIRPDGYVAWACARSQESLPGLPDALSRWFGDPRPANTSVSRKEITVMTDAPWASSLQDMADLTTPMALRVAATLRLSDHVHAGTTGLSGLATVTGAHSDGLARLMRHLVAVGVFRDAGGDSWALTDLGKELCSRSPGDARSWLDLDSAVSRAELALFDLLPAVRLGGPSEGRSWDDLDTDKDLSDSFDDQMAAGAAAKAPGLIEGYDWASVKHVVDVGGGNGTLLIELLRARPHLRGTVVDRPNTAANAERKLAAAGFSDRATTSPQSFFDKLPADGDVYLLSGVLHDWSDAEAARILGRCAEAAKPAGRVLVMESLLQEGTQAASTTEMDLLMLVCTGGRARSADDLNRLAEGSGMAVKSVTPLTPPHSLVEFTHSS